MRNFEKKAGPKLIMSKIFLSTLIGLFSISLQAQEATLEYIEAWHKVAIAEMKEFGIPASITLAQGILESGNGKSELAQKSRNHFGIKCHEDWKGDRVYHDDDEDNECFRKYDQAEDSFRDHSLFLKNRGRYASLFEEDPTDYKAWAKGLKKAGYATNPKYASLLIDLIEKYQLHRYDLELGSEDLFDLDQLIVRESDNRVDYVISREGDTWEIVANLTDKHVEDLLEYNELRFDAILEPGQIIYLQPKRRRANRENRFYVVREGESLYDISQKFAIRLEKIYKKNDLNAGQQVKPGTKLRLR